MAAIEQGVPYYFYTPSQANRFCLNAPTDTDFVGYVSDVTGLDSPGIRENAQVVVAGDGGYHGPFWGDRRPWTMAGTIMPQFPLLARDQAQEKIEGIIMSALKSDGFLTWTPADGVQKMLKFRAQQPPRMSKGQSSAVKTFTIACVTADFRVLSWTLQQSSLASGATPLNVNCQNIGNADAAPHFKITGPITNPVITNTITGKRMTWTGSVPSGGLFEIDLTGTYPYMNNAGTDWSQFMDPLNTDWSLSVGGIYTVSGGNNTFQLTGTGTSGVTNFQTLWYHSWV